MGYNLRKADLIPEVPDRAPDGTRLESELRTNGTFLHPLWEEDDGLPPERWIIFTVMQCGVNPLRPLHTLDAFQCKTDIMCTGSMQE